MSKERFLFVLKAFIILSPLPYGCVSRIWSPLFYLSLLVFTAFSLNLVTKKENILFEAVTRKALLFLFIFFTVQVVPLPRFLLNLLSPKTIEILDRISITSINFHSISVLPMETVGFLFRLFVILLFFRILLRIHLKFWEIYSILYTILVSAAIQVVIGLIKYFQGNTHFFVLFQKVETVSTHRLLVGTIANPSHFSFYLELVAPLALVILLVKLFSVKFKEKARVQSSRIRRDELLLLVVFILLATAGIVLSGSQIGVVVLVMSAVLVAAGFLYILSVPDIRRKIGIIAAASAFVIIVFALVQAETTFINPHTMQETGDHYKGRTAEILKDFPVFGSGFGTFRYLYLLYDTGEVGWLTHSHNEYMESMAEGGVVGGTLLLFVLISLFTSLFVMWTRRNHPEIRTLTLGIVVSLTAASVHSFHDFALRIPANIFLLTLLAIIGFKLATYKDRMLYHGNKTIY